MAGREKQPTKSHPSVAPAEYREPIVIGEGVIRIGVLQCIGGFDDSSLRYLILCANRCQTYFQFEFVPFNRNDPFLRPLLTGTTVERVATEHELVNFYRRQSAYMANEARAYHQAPDPPARFQVLSAASFADGYYFTSNGLVAVIAMGQWKRSLAPPSIVEFIQTIALEDAILGACQELSTHLGTRGCLFDFTAELFDARQKVLASSICQSCQKIMTACGHEDLLVDLGPLLSREWLGSRSDAVAPAAVTAKLGHDLFLTKGLKPSLAESIKMALAEEGTKQILKIIGAVVLAALLLFLGLAVTGNASAEHVPSRIPATRVGGPEDRAVSGSDLTRGPAGQHILTEMADRARAAWRMD